ncbi:MAG: hypothetical protein A2998_00880 [Candidatus Staskawiczbacteria bacterium RIFCSPLOWO2_01_FULL_37_25b]|uniref:Uncharacterized protein n=1 Tax=Candidatus Staskawiczbacteria bacterium RIFCSPLOWO2_01_FULL_37_25b TaxID=1802213 RepID=A0A1G2IH27_9BACT|nr:MAG: hypothetical protein A2998_00880 [Candidatus Staskawiczbacteria bacterium RIFCSPLOWO2_01_FULL_37_25b]
MALWLFSKDKFGRTDHFLVSAKTRKIAEKKLHWNNRCDKYQFVGRVPKDGIPCHIYGLLFFVE